MTPLSIVSTFAFTLALGAGTIAAADPGSAHQALPTQPGPRPAPASGLRTGLSSPRPTCRRGEDTLRVLKLTTFDGGVRVDYEFVVSGRATWTNMNPPLLKQFGIRAAGLFCLPKEAQAADEVDYE